MNINALIAEIESMKSDAYNEIKKCCENGDTNSYNLGYYEGVSASCAIIVNLIRTHVEHDKK